MKRTDKSLRELLERVSAGVVDVEGALAELHSVEASAGHGCRIPELRIDHDRERRCGFPEVVYGQGKTLEQLRAAVKSISERSGRVLVTRLDGDMATDLLGEFPEAEYHDRARCLTMGSPGELRGQVTILTAGSTDVPIAEEARITALTSGSRVSAHYDVGVAGLHRLLGLQDELAQARVIIVVAGMDGALPSVVGGLSSSPVIAVPTSIGYGASFGGVAALLSMLNSCSPGLAVVNIDSGFGAGMLASRINLMSPGDADA